MTNWEKFKDQITTTAFAVSKECKIDSCGVMRCENCLFAINKTGDCSESRIKWLKAEYNDPKERMKQAKVDFLNTLSSNILCDTYSHCSECPMYLLRGHKFDNSTCSTVVRAILAEGIKKVIGNE